MAYRSIEQKIWQDSKFRKLSKDCKLAFIYLITNNSSHYCGLYYLPYSTIEYETGLSSHEVSSALEELTSKGMVKYDFDNDIVWVINMASYQCKSGQKKLIIGIVNHLQTIESYLVSDFESHYCDKLSLGYP